MAAIITVVGIIMVVLYISYRLISGRSPSLGERGQPKKTSQESNDAILERRDLMKMLLVGGVAAVTKTIVASQWPRRRWDEIADVVIVGFGAAGAAAAIEAADQGASVLILEKMPIGGGTTAMSGGTIYAAETSIQEEAEISDSAGEMFKLLMATGKGLNRPELVELVARQSSEIVEWLIKLGVEFWPGAFLGEPFGCELYPEYADITRPVPRVHAAKGMGEALFRNLKSAVTKGGIGVWLDAPATELMTHGGEVIGVVARSKWGDLNLRARRAVILATGGFMHNKRMLSRFCQKGYISLPLGNPGDEGDGIRLARRLGANLCAMTETNGLPAVRIAGKELGRPLLLNYYGFPCVLVDQMAQRFVNEGIFYEFVNDALLDLEGETPAYVIFDDKVRTRAQDQIVKYFSGDLEREISEGLVIQADTIESLAEKIGLDSIRLGETIQRYNDYASAGRDLDFGKTHEMGLGPIGESPFYAIGVYPGMIATAGGLKINTDAQVLDVSDVAVPRLYAAGRTTGGVMGAVFPASGVNLLDAICFGRIAGRNAALS